MWHVWAMSSVCYLLGLYDGDVCGSAYRYRGTYCGQDVAIKVLKPERLNDNLKREFQQEVFIMRYVSYMNLALWLD